VYDAALKQGIEKTKGFRVAPIPYTKETVIQTEEDIDEINERGPIMPK